jgi:putative nucleotidyltransferase with HDIG domain
MKMGLAPQDAKNLEELLKNIVGAMKSVVLYPPGHPSVKRPITACMDIIKNLLLYLPKVNFSHVEGILVVCEKPFYDTNIHARELVSRFSARKIDHVDIFPAVTEDELSAFLQILNMEPKALEEAGGLAGELKKRGVQNIRSKSVRQIYDHAVAVVEEAMQEVRLGRIPESSGAIQVVEEMKDAVLSDKRALVGLTLIKSYDEYLFNHSVNVSVLSLALAEEVNVPKEDLNAIGLAGLLHDIGKTRTPKEITLKPGKLTKEEWEEMKKHPLASYEIVSKMDGISELTAKIVLEHHVHFDMKGYPELPEGHKVHTYSQLISVADTYDAMTTLRPYQAPFTPKEALDLMEKKLVGQTIDPQYFNAFVKMLGIYPVGTLVRLDTNEIALVVDVSSRNYLLPKVKIVIDPTGKRLPEAVEIDLASLDESLGDIKRTIVSTVDPLLVNIDTSQYI